MGKAIVTGIVIVVIVLVAAGYFIWQGRHQARQENLKAGRPVKGDLSRSTEQQLVAKLDQAANIMRIMTASTGSLDGDFITKPSQAAIASWLSSYQDLRKELERA